MQDSSIHQFYKNGSITSNYLPTQTVSDSRKNESWCRQNLDALESIGIRQIAGNTKFRDLYKMLEGRLAYSDYIEEGDILDKIKGLADDIAVPSWVKHYDFIGIITRQIVGEWLDQKDDFKVDSIDDISQNDFLRERTSRIRKYSIETFEKELEIALMKEGIDVNKTDFQSEEERQQYIEMLEQEKAKIISPAQIEKEMKDWKTKAAEWAEHVLEKDQERFYMDRIDKQEMEDYLLTGRFFRHYYVGYDYYKPERWSPLETFFSEDVEAENPQDGEFVGRIFYISKSDVLKRYGHRLNPNDIKEISKQYEATGTGSNVSGGNYFSGNNMSKGMFGYPQTVPFENYHDYDLGMQIQNALEIPMGETLVDTPNGQQRLPSWLTPMHNVGHIGSIYSSYRRDDINVRNDLLQVTEGYWRSWKKMWFLNYTTEAGYQATELVTDELLKEYIEENGIKKITNKSLHDIRENLEPDTMYEFWIPEVWTGVKINSGNSLLRKDIYVGIEPLPFQIKGDSNIFDVKLPVGGIIGQGIAQKVRPFQIGYNVCLNQIWNLLEKEIGMFFLFDINFLPSEFKDQGNMEDSLDKLRDLAKGVGIVPIDTTKQNLQGASQQMNTLQTQDVSFDKQIKSRIELSEWYKRKGLEQIGITDQRLGQVSVYETATGVKQGNEASYTQTAEIFNNMSVARRKTMELHLAVAQYCQKEYIDVDMVFSSSDGDKAFMNLTDPNFPLRRLGVMPVNNPKKRRDLENLRQTLLNMNTLGSDMLDYAQLFSSDSISTLVDIGKRGRAEKQAEIEAQRNHEQTLLDKKLASEAQEKDKERAFEASENQKDRINELQSEEINAYGRAADKDANQLSFDTINREAELAIKQSKNESDIQINQAKLENSKAMDSKKLQLLKEQVDLEVKKFEQRERQMQNDRYISQINKN